MGKSLVSCFLTHDVEMRNIKEKNNITQRRQIIQLNIPEQTSTNEHISIHKAVFNCGKEN